MKKILFLLLAIQMSWLSHAQIYNTAPNGDTWYKVKTRKQHLCSIRANAPYAEHRSIVFLISGIWNTAEVTVVSEYNYDHKTMDILYGYVGSGADRYLAIKTSPITATSANGFTIKELEDSTVQIELEEITNPSAVTQIFPQSTLHVDEHAKKVGVGTITPSNLLEIKSTTSSTNPALESENDLGVSSYFYTGRSGNTYVANSTVIENASGNNLILNPSGGNVGIGTTNPSNKLEVNGTIRTKEVVVESTGWPDYVFSDTYKLNDLSEVSNYIEENGHLPNIPSAAEVEQNGIKLGEMNAKLLEKIEELTLYLIEQQDQILSQNEQIQLLRAEVKSLKLNKK